MTNPTSDPYWCPECQIHRTRTATGLCPSCDDLAKHPERGED